MLDRTSTVQTDTLIRVKNLRDEDTGAFANTATVTCTIVTTAGVPVPGQSWPLTLAYKTGSNGEYRGVLQDTAVLTAGVTYVARITAIAAGIQKYWEISFKHLLDVGPV